MRTKTLVYVCKRNERTTKINDMRTIYLRRKASGNYEIVTGKPKQKEHTHKFRTWKALQEFYWDLYGRKVIKAEYRVSNTYFNSFAELKNFIKTS